MSTPSTRKTACARNSQKLAQINLDALSLSRIAWAEHVTAHITGTAATASVIVRRALQQYVKELERLLTTDKPERRIFEAGALRRAAKGNTDSLPQEALSANPPRRFSDIEREASRKAAADMRSQIFQPFIP